MLMHFVDLACEVRKIGMQVDFGARDRPMACIAAHIQEIHPTFFEFGEHQMAHLVRRQLGISRAWLIRSKISLTVHFETGWPGLRCESDKKMGPFASAP